jgi:uncharacterized protein (TIGR01319 family)
MNTNTSGTHSVLAVDIGSTQTRVMFFDVVSGRYRFIGRGTSPTTIGAPFFDAAEGIWRAIEKLQTTTERIFINKEGGLIIPSTPDNEGVDIMVATMSAGPPLRTVIVGLLDDVSLKHAQHLAETTYSKIVSGISLNDQRTPTDRINLITSIRPDMIILTGGTNGGATKSILSMVELVGLASYLIEKNQKPHIIFAGNKDLKNEVSASLDKISKLHITENVQPLLGNEQLYPAQKTVSEVYNQIRLQQTGGIRELLSWTNGHFTSSAAGLGRAIKFLSQKYEPEKGVLGVDLGSQNTVIAGGFSGEEVLKVYPRLGVGSASRGVLDESSLLDIQRWLSVPISTQQIENYIYNKSAYPEIIPAEPEELEIEHAVAKQALRIAAQRSLTGINLKQKNNYSNLLPPVEPIIGAGRVLTEAPSHLDSFNILLDGLQPSGVTTLALDQNNMLSALGAISERNPLLTVQIIESSTFLNLGTVIAPVGTARIGTPILRVTLSRADGRTSTRDIKYGTIVPLPVESGEKVSLHLRPFNRFDIGMGGPGKSGKVNAVGGVLGVIIDARGRPLPFSADMKKNTARNASWRKMLQKLG